MLRFSSGLPAPAAMHVIVIHGYRAGRYIQAAATGGVTYLGRRDPSACFAGEVPTSEFGGAMTRTCPGR
jgi:hypothetical protein